MKLETGLAVRHANNFDFLPGNCLGPTSSKRFHCCFLGSKPHRIACKLRRSSLAIAALRISEYTLPKSIASTQKHLLDATYLNQVDPYRDNHPFRPRSPLDLPPKSYLEKSRALPEAAE